MASSHDLSWGMSQAKERQEPVGSGGGAAGSLESLSALSVSIVSYAPDLDVLVRVLTSLLRELEQASSDRLISDAGLYIVDNGPGNEWKGRLKEISDHAGFGVAGIPVTIISGHGNVGFGGGHNLAIRQSQADVHLILNPDAVIEPGSLSVGVSFLLDNADTALLSPLATWPDGTRQYLCKKYPTLASLGLRGFGPRWLQHVFKKRLADYELQHIQMNSVAEVPLASGCFMLARRQNLVEVGGFSPKYFMYFEDFDLSLRLGRTGRIVYHPGIRIVHEGGRAAKKGWRHIWMFAKSGFTFFNEHGWKLI